MKTTLTILVLCFTLSAFSQNITVRTFSAPGAGTASGQGTLATAMNSKGFIAGNYIDANSIYHGFVRTVQGVITPFDAFGAQSRSTQVSGVNTSGTVTGSFLHCLDQQCANHVTYGYTRTAIGRFVQITATPTASITAPFGINDSGQVVGFYNEFGMEHGFSFQNGVVTLIDYPGSILTVATAINASGTIVGYWADAGSVFHAFLRDPLGNFTSFDPAIDATAVYATAINTSGEIAGWYNNSRGAFLYARAVDGTITTITLSGNPFIIGFSTPVLNDSGEMAGAATLNNGAGKAVGYARATGGKITQLQIFGDPTAIYAINNIGQLAGTYQVNGVWNGFMF